ncbi:unnamed protein product [Caenorhabditis auriculariae]|uniref:Eukaryotic translation initiation factor 2 subunit 2 n=1 Tax=Caenorhabditis auriculariae TaxID=2777116 RepID=A0A8S1GN81_9PELO|nr:unnamed protein product [Caenorhabditis auriculariae]
MADDLGLELGKKKKTKKIIKLDDEDEDEAVVPTAENINEDLGDLNLTGKKKRKAPKVDVEDVVEKVPQLDIGIGASNLIDASKTWPDYTYEECLNLVFQIMKEKNPELAGEKKKFAMKPPEVGRAGSKKTAFSNFAEICRLMKRQDKHVLQFLLAELGTTGSIDGNNCLIVKGRWQQKHFESVLRKYIKEYVMCHTCRSSDTQLEKETRLFFLQCNACGSRCSVVTIKSGFTAMDLSALICLLNNASLEKFVNLLERNSRDHSHVTRRALKTILHRVALCDESLNKCEVIFRLLRLFKEDAVRDETFQLLTVNRKSVTKACFEVFSENHWTLTEEECLEIIEMLEEETLSFRDLLCRAAWLDRAATLLRLLRLSNFRTGHVVRKLARKVVLMKNEEVSNAFVSELAVVDVCHPLVVFYCQPSTSSLVFPQVFSAEYLVDRVLCSLTEFIDEVFSETNDAGSDFLRIVFKNFDFLVGLMQSAGQLHRENLTPISDLCWRIISLTDATGSGELSKFVPILSQIALSFDPTSRALFLKRLLHLAASNTAQPCSYEPQLVAVIIDEYKKGIRLEEFQLELGELWDVLRRIRYENIYNASAFYSALFVLARAQALHRLKPGVLNAVRNVLFELHAQIVDFQKLQNVDSKATKNTMEEYDEQIKNLGAEIFPMVMYEYDLAIADIENAIGK